MHRSKRAKPPRPPAGPKLVGWGIEATVDRELTSIERAQIDPIILE
jgi:hypothetical protein